MENKIEYKGFTIEIVQDTDPFNPRTDYDHAGKMICFHKRYTLGDKHNLSLEEAQELYARKDVIALPLFLLDHSGITIRTTSFGDPWDSGQVGFIYMDYDTIKKEFDCKKVTQKIILQVYDRLRSEVKEYDDYLTGNVWGFIIEPGRGYEEDSCFGFMGDPSYAVSEAKSVIDYRVENPVQYIEHEATL